MPGELTTPLGRLIQHSLDRQLAHEPNSRRLRSPQEEVLWGLSIGHRVHATNHPSGDVGGEERSHGRAGEWHFGRLSKPGKDSRSLGCRP